MFNPAMVYDMIGEIYSVLICLTYLVTILLYMKVSLGLRVVTLWDLESIINVIIL